jgi:HK97 gp10 family phage protein
VSKTPRHIEGLEGVIERLNALPREIVGKNGGPVKSALRKGAKLIRDEAARRAPVKTGKLRDALTVRRDPRPHYVSAAEHYWIGVQGGARRKYANTKRNRGKARVGQTYEVEGNAFYWRFYEFGSEHQPARPFVRSAFEAKVADVEALIASELNKQLDRITKKLNATRTA